MVNALVVKPEAEGQLNSEKWGEMNRNTTDEMDEGMSEPDTPTNTTAEFEEEDTKQGKSFLVILSRPGLLSNHLHALFTHK